MFESKAPDALIKILDFGLAQKYCKGAKFTDQVGTVTTMSPELIRGEYNQATDMWSIGVIAYELVSGCLPFDGTERGEVALKIIKGEYSVYGIRWKAVSQDAKDFIRRCLQADPTLRITPTQALRHAWLSMEVSSHGVTESSLHRVLVSAGAQSAANSEFRQLALQAIARKASTAEIVRLREAFYAMDEDHDGSITLSELKKCLGSTYDTAVLEKWFKSIDVDDSGSIDYTEFLAATLDAQAEISEESMMEAFRIFDKNDTGYITPDNLRDVLGRSEASYIDELIREADANNDGKISFQEFSDVLARTAKNKMDFIQQPAAPMY